MPATPIRIAGLAPNPSPASTPAAGTAPRRPARASAAELRAALAALAVSIALLAAPRPAEALIAHDDPTALPRFVPPVGLATGSRLRTTVEGDALVLHGYVEDELERFLARRAIAARADAPMRIVDRVLVLPARGTGAVSAYPDGAREFCRLDVDAGRPVAPRVC